MLVKKKLILFLSIVCCKFSFVDACAENSKIRNAFQSSVVLATTLSAIHNIFMTKGELSKNNGFFSKAGWLVYATCISSCALYLGYEASKKAYEYYIQKSKRRKKEEEQQLTLPDSTSTNLHQKLPVV